MNDAPILIVEDEADIAELIQFHVERSGYDARMVHSGKIALDVINRSPPRLIVLDLMLPDVDGLEICRRLKWDAQTRAIPILIVSAKGEEADIVTGIELGADDYVTKPFSPRELMARLKNILRRYEHRDAEPDESDGNRISLAGGGLMIDRDRHEVRIDGKPVELTVTEFGILEYLASRPGFVRTRDQIISAVHGNQAVLSSRTVDVHVTSLRRKLGAFGSTVQTVRGVGYRLTEYASDEQESPA